MAEPGRIGAGIVIGVALGWRFLARIADHQHGGSLLAIDHLPKTPTRLLAKLVLCHCLVGGNVLVAIHFIAHLRWHAQFPGRVRGLALGGGIGLVLRRCGSARGFFMQQR